jgi:hypothetical protein
MSYQQLSLLDVTLVDDQAERGRHDGGQHRRHGGDGPARLLRALVRHGLADEHLRVAALLVLELDAKPGR